ncbi:MAG: hypothetical protein GX066_03255 [Clostridiaceae bacterium]|nr:hypothetical protein [Clostridiaceae bacterium]
MRSSNCSKENGNDWDKKHIKQIRAKEVYVICLVQESWAGRPIIELRC